MARRPRIDVAGVPQHIIVRGIDRQPCFFRLDDRVMYLDMLAGAAMRHAVAVHAFVLMTNHVHLLATGSTPGALSAMMHLCGARYVRRINQSYRRTGPLFEGRFRSSLVESESYLLACMRYIELNPVRAGLVARPQEHPWSSYGHNTGSSTISWLTQHEEFLRLGRSASDRARTWQELVRSTAVDDEAASIRKHVNQNAVLGTRAFQEQIAAMVGRRVDVRPPGRPWPSRAEIK